RAKIEEALRGSETLYQSLVDNIPQNVLRKDREGRFVFGNKSFLINLGISLDELVGKTDFDFYPAELAEKYRRDDQKVLETGELFETVEQHQPASGAEKYVRVVKSPIYDPNGEVAGIQGIFWDITERKQAEEALRESEARFRSLASNIPGAIYRCALDADRTMEFMSAATEALIGYPTSDFIGKRVRSYASIIHPEDRVMVEKGVLEGIEAKQPYTVEYRIIKAGGQVRWVHERGQAIYDEAGQVLWLDGVLFDITERKQAEEALAKQARMTAFSADVGLALTKTMTLPEALQNCAESMVQHLDAAFARIWTLAPGENILMLRASAGMYTHLDGSHARVPLGMFKIGWIAQERQPHLTNTLVGDPHVGDQKWAKREGMVAFAGYPLLIEGRLVGVMAMFARKPLADDTLQAMEAVANTIALAIERKQAEEALKEAFQRTQLLYNITEALATLINQQAAFETVLGEYLLLLNVSRGGIMLLDPDGEYNTLQALYIDNKVVEPNLVFPAKEDFLAQYLQQNPFPLVIEDVSSHALTQHNQALRGQVESMLVVPVVTRGDVVGIIGADATEKGRTFTRDDIEIGKAIADQLAIWLENRQLLEEAQYRSERLQTAAIISRAASSILDVNQLINTSVNLIRDQFDFYYVGLFMVDKAREWAVLRAGTGEAGRIQLERKHQLKIGGESMIGWSIQNRQARIALDVGQEAVRFQNPFLPNTHSEMALPLISRDEVIGALTVQSTEQGAFLPEDITLLQTMADQLANAIENARLFESVMQAQREAEDLLKDTQALQQFSQTLAGTLQINEIINIFFEACTQVMGFEYAIFCLVDKYQHRVKAIAGFGVTESNIKRANRSLDSQDIMVDIVKTGQTEIITGWDERLDRETFEAEGHNDWMRIFTPITLRQENIGLIEVGFNKNTGQIIEEAQIRLLRAFIDQTALALDNAQRYEASQRAARREALIKEITTKVRASTQIDTILQTTVKEVGDALSSKRAYVHLVSPTNGEAK
ncbi:MAG TPA: GAF domain-containing protein, partial [Anaerolineae bacterium]|nr:GAF domain-containing protein [Anaerolineae bacterium]